MLRECHRVLNPGGRLVGYVIHTPDGLSRADRLRAAELGPSQVAAAVPPVQLARSVGFDVIHEEDVSTALRATAKALFDARAGLEPTLRTEEGSDIYDEEQRKKRGVVEGLDAGLLARSLLVAIKP